MQWRWNHFKPHEVLSPDGMAQLARNNLKLQGKALDNLEFMRTVIDKPMWCNHGELQRRGYRSQKENKAAGGVADSQHVQGVAFDLSCYDIKNVEFAVVILRYTWDCWNATKNNSHAGVRGLGVYGTFCHCDWRSFPSYKENYIVVWDGNRGNKSFILPLDKPYQEVLDLFHLGLKL